MSAKDGANLSPVRDAISYNGRLPKTLPEPIKRARGQDLRGFAGEGNVVERSERHASEAKPEEPKDSKRRAWAGLLAAGFFCSIDKQSRQGWRDCSIYFLGFCAGGGLSGFGFFGGGLLPPLLSTPSFNGFFSTLGSFAIFILLFFSSFY